MEVGKPSLSKMSYSAPAATMKCHILCDLNVRHLFSDVMETGKSKIKIPAYPILGKT